MCGRFSEKSLRGIYFVGSTLVEKAAFISRQFARSGIEANRHTKPESSTSSADWNFVAPDKRIYRKLRLTRSLNYHCLMATTRPPNALARRLMRGEAGL